ncbi:hypothetical protein [Pigmentiphaga litoralis]|uniref:Uncharacterized protein n=1 Tax=Pigmentiphaga litoralis TaxID=516702 RepID=A0A7Y9IUH2_9BURK|nr:hypothetical protein [Pigmentiphaga litoralis]NYE23048.1 hypothetical protein [Pigmentiphaga litoralis]NYE83337.1 hypothetical protein [Pigmentiphaga litoralis]
MTTPAHDLKPGYYWYYIESDPPSIIHIRDTGEASLMGSDYDVPAEDVASMIRRGEQFVWIEPPLGR